METARTLHLISYGTELLALLVTILWFLRRRSRITLLLLLLMGMIMLTESLGKFKAIFAPYIPIFVVQNMGMLLEIGIYLCVYYIAVGDRSLKRWIAGLTLVYAAFSAAAAIFLQPLHSSFPTYSIVLGGLFILAAILIYFYEGLRHMEHVNLYKDPLFYISIGLFLFYANEIPVMTLLNYYLEHHASAQKVYFIFNLKLVVSIIYYSLYSFGILWTIRK